MKFVLNGYEIDAPLQGTELLLDVLRGPLEQRGAKTMHETRPDRILVVEELVQQDRGGDPSITRFHRQWSSVLYDTL